MNSFHLKSAQWHSSGKRLFSYGNPQSGVENPDIYRKNYGVALWNAGYDGAMDFAYQYPYGDIWNDYDSQSTHYRDHVFAYPTSNGVIDTIQWEGWREGVDDTRYVASLIKKDGSTVSAKAIVSAGLANNDNMTTIRKNVISQILDSQVNHAPQLATIGNKSVPIGNLLTFTVSATDLDNNSLTYSASNLPANATFNPATRTFTWTPASSQAGTYTVTFAVTDGSLTDSESVRISATALNRAPVLATIGNKSVPTGNLLTFTVSATDLDNNSLTYSASNLPANATFNPATRTFTWTPASSQAGTYTVTFAVTDGSLTDSESVRISATALNRAPVLATIGNKSVPTGTLLTFTVSATDLDNNSLTYSASNLPANATFNPATRTFTWTPTSSQAGTYTVTFAVTDGSLTDSESVRISATALNPLEETSVNRAPALARFKNMVVSAGRFLTFTVSATDLDSNSLTYSASNLPTNAIFNPATRTFSWTPTPSQAGTYMVTFAVTDGLLSDIDSVRITVNAVPKSKFITKSVAVN